MEPTRRRLLATTAAAIALAGCTGGDGDGGDGDGGAGATETATRTATDGDGDGDGGGRYGGGDGATETATETSAGGSPTVQVRSHPDHGDVLVDSEGMTLYVFDADTKGAGESACTGGCLDAWPPLSVEGSPTAGDGVTADLAAFDRGDGTTQVAANGWPLYYFASDESPGDAKGQGVQDAWWVVRPDGTPVRSNGTATATATRTETATATAAPDVETTVRLSGFAFDPVRTSVDPGGTVEWVNEDGATHDVTATTFHGTAADWEFSASLPGGASTTYTFEKAGVYEYYCTIHGESSMCGVVLVGDAGLDANLPCEGGY